MKMSKFFGKAALLAATGLSMSAMLATGASAAETFNFASGGSASSNTYGNVWTFTGTGGTKVEVSGYSYDGSNLYTGWIQQYSPYGLGLTNSSNDDSHTVDNSGRTDILVLQFDKTVNVSQLDFTAWGDTDLTYAFGNTNVAFNSTLSFSTWSALDAAFGAFTASNGTTLSDGTAFSRTVSGSGNLLFISAALPNPDRADDLLKVKGLTETPAVPEPATWAMMIGGLGLVGMSMRRRKTAVSFA